MASPSESRNLVPAEVLRERFDCVVMLTWSDWRREMRKNRYHYATRFARALPVLFVQPDLHVDEYRFEATEVENLEILHLIIDYTSGSQRRRFVEALRARGFRRPLMWIYNFYLLDLACHTWAPMKVYHATEDYFMRDVFAFTEAEMLQFHRVLEQVDLLVTVSQGVLDHYQECSQYRRRALVLPNGCDFGFWKPTDAEVEGGRAASSSAGDTALHLPRDTVDEGAGDGNRRRPVAFFQGLVMKKFDFDLFEDVVVRMPDWDFSLCGEVTGGVDRFEAICRRPNVKFHGKLGVDEVRRLSLEADVGLIPYVQLPYITESSLPLKAYEYLATGLPVVTVPIRALEGYEEVFAFGRTAEEWERAIRRMGTQRWEAGSLATRLEMARGEDYDRRFETLAQAVSTLENWAQPPARPLRVLVAYEARGENDLACLGRHCPDAVDFVGVDALAAGDVDLDRYDAVVLDRSVGVAGWQRLESAESWLGYAGLRVAVTRAPQEWPRDAWSRPHLLVMPPGGALESGAGLLQPDLHADREADERGAAGANARDTLQCPHEDWESPALLAAWVSARLRERIRSRVEETRWGTRLGAPALLAPCLQDEDGSPPLSRMPLGFALAEKQAGLPARIDWDDLRSRVRRLFPPPEGLRSLPLAKWIDGHVFKPFNRFWEQQRERIAGGAGKK